MLSKVDDVWLLGITKQNKMSLYEKQIYLLGPTQYIFFKNKIKGDEAILAEMK